MAENLTDGSHGNVRILPTAIHLDEEQFPSPISSPSPQASNRQTSEHATQNDTTYAPKHPSPTHTDYESDPDSIRRPQLPPKSVTERPQPKSRASLLGRNRRATAGKAPRLARRATLTFDPYSSDSSSSSDGEAAPIPDNHESKPQPRPAQGQKRKSDRDPYSRFKIANEHFNTKGKVSKLDGRLKLSINETVNSGYFAKTLGAGLKKHFKGGDDRVESNAHTGPDGEGAEKIAPEADEMEDPRKRVRLNIVVIVIGSRGDIQPFLKVGKILKEDYGHNVRIATHPAFKKFVEEDSGLDFFSVGGDPSELMAFMVKNPGLVPSVDTIKGGEIGKRRAAMYEMFQGMWRACINSTDDETDDANMKMMGDKHPFVADAIIANPPSFAPPHIAERLGVPLHMMFTFPYTPTVQFPHPLANIKPSNVDANYTNFMSYPLVEMMTWQGLGDLINRFRTKTLFLEEVSTLWAPGQLYRLKVPYTYMWSPSLVPKPKDWGPEIDIAGFVFLELASSFKPPESLTKFLDAGPPPVYIGFGSIVVDDPDKFTKLIFEATKMAGVRALVSKGWGGLGDDGNTPDNIYMLENTPHDWLFPRVSAVVHHGGAGTTAIGLKCGRPTMIVPFFGDQPFWGAMVSKAKAGAHECIPYKKLTVERLAEGIKQCLTEEAKENVQKIADSIAEEGDGARNAVRSFHRSLPLRGEHNMRCQVLDNQVATWKLKNTDLRLCPLAAELLVEWKKIKWNDLRLLRHFEWNDFGGPGEPFTGGWGAIMGTVSDVATGIGLVPVNMAKSVKKREKYYEKVHKIKKRQKHAKEALAKANADIPGANGDTKGHENTNGVAKDTKKSMLKTKSDRPNPPSRHGTNETTISKLSVPEEYLAEELAHEAGHGFSKSGGALLRAPMEFTLAITQGFHNAPRLYGDETVRRPPRVTGFHSGLRAGRDEFVYGIRDGVTGLWMQPYRGARDGGVVGLLQGVGMGIGGLVLKDIAAFFGPPAYAMKGLHEESLKKYQPTNFLRRARIIQGVNELAALSQRTSHELDAGDPGRKATGEETRKEEEKAKKADRHEVELSVSKRWEVLQAQVLVDKHSHKSGLRASVLGKKVRGDGAPVPRKQRKSKAEIPVNAVNGEKKKKSKSMPSNEAEKAVVDGGDGDRQSEGGGDDDDDDKSTRHEESTGTDTGINGKPLPATNSISRTATAPQSSISTSWLARPKRKTRLDNVPAAVKQEARNEANRKNKVPSVWSASLQGNGHAVGSETKTKDRDGEKEGVGNARDVENENQRPRARSEVTDWAAVRQGVEDKAKVGAK
ncbi:hypothetical protein BCR34DRAFT_598830 [Clohesyomyces aquaticus]|uniref:Uncharacterized protein n=1 Tax=Clohesyomyces aquaticus TaxID=1231657 RepID=A0A1Y1ZXE8_9PLEO|nr:hypothetical protein BCR34DRAFT_598830 [Clohesyomyces aquaticus]